MSKDLTLVRDGECNQLQVLVPTNRLKSMFGDAYNQKTGLFGTPDEPNTMIEIGWT